MSTWISLDLIDVSHKQRKKVARSKVERHRAAYENGDAVRPIDIVAHATCKNGVRYRILGNGRHRYFGALEAGMPVIECEIHDSSLESW